MVNWKALCIALGLITSLLSIALVGLALWYVALDESYNVLKARYRDLEIRYRELQQELQKLHTVTMLPPVIESGKLRIESRPIPHTSLGKVYGYTIMVNVTNVWYRPIDVVWILLLPYKDGKLVSYWDPCLFSKKIEGLYVGESRILNFTVLEDISAYRIVTIVP